MIPLRPAPPPTTAAAPAPMNTNEKVPMNSARSFGAIRLDIVDSRGEIDRPARSDLRRGTMRWLLGNGRRRGRGWPAGENEGAYSAGMLCGFKTMPLAFATPVPYSGSAL